MNYYEGDKYEEQKEYLRDLFMKDGVFNIHGHTHGNSISEGMLFNVSVENISFKPIKFKDIESWFKETKL
jgi:calcineurin-like phosphoesterase family protein